MFIKINTKSGFYLYFNKIIKSHEVDTRISPTFNNKKTTFNKINHKKNIIIIYLLNIFILI